MLQNQVDEATEAQSNAHKEKYLESIRTDIYNNATFLSTGGIAFASVVYSIGLAVSYMLYVGLTPGAVVYIVGIVIPSVMISAAFGLFATLAFDFLNQSIRSALSIPAQAANAGGFVGYFMVAPFLLWNMTLNPWAVLLGPCIAMLCGQIGASYAAAWNVREHVIQHAKLSGFERKVIIERLGGSKNWQFQVRDIAVLTTWIAGMLAILRGIGLYGFDLTGFFLGWLFLTIPMSWLVASWTNQIVSKVIEEDSQVNDKNEPSV